MKKEEKAVRDMFRLPIGSTFIFKHQQSVLFQRRITALVHAVREDCAKVADTFPAELGHGKLTVRDAIAAAIRGKK